MAKSALIALGLATIQLAAGAQFKYGVLGSKSDEIDLKIPRPPDAYLSKKSIRVEVADPTRQFGLLPGLKSAIEQALQPDFSVVASNPETLFRLSIVSHVRPQSRKFAQQESRRVKVGQRPRMRNGKVVLDKNGRPEMEDVYQTRLVPVQYWEGSGKLSAKVEVYDLTARDGSGNPPILHGMAPSHSYAAKREIAVNHVATITPGGTPSAAEIDQIMLQEVAAAFAPAYKDTFDTTKVLLAVDDELRPINQRALAGDYANALGDYENVRMRKPKTEGDRIYNIAVMKEIIAYQKYVSTRSPDDAQPLFLDALQTYDKAMQLDPEEKYIVRARQRLETAKSNFDNAKKIYAAQRLEAQKLVAEMEARRREDDEKRLAEEARVRSEEARVREEEATRKRAEEQAANRSDSPQEDRFRKTVRLRLRGVVDPAKVDAPKLEAMGPAFRLTQQESKRVVGQEIARIGSLVIYRDTFLDLVKDKVLSSEERASLTELAASLRLLLEETGPVEATSPFQEPGRTQARTQPPVERPKLPATKPTAPAPRPVPTVQQSKPTPGLVPRK